MGDKFTSYEITKILEKLMGDIEPIGETHHDDVAYANLLTYIEVATWFIERIYEVGQYIERPEFSMQRSGKEAIKYLSKLNTDISELCSEMLL